MDYRSPIEIYTHEPIFKEMEDGVMHAVINLGVQIDKDELIRALAYDREQYEKGYTAARRIYKRPIGEWRIDEPGESGLGTIYKCPYCKYKVEFVPTNFCPNCGADMRGEEK